MNNKSRDKVAYVVLSCDPYSDIWDAYGELFSRFWPDCPYNFYMASHTKSFDKFGFKPILIGEDISWSHGLLFTLNKLQEEGYAYAIIAFDDLLLNKPVDTAYVTSAIDAFIGEGGQCLRFDPYRTSHCLRHNRYYGKMYNPVPYRVTLGFTLWNIETLKHLTVEGESAWQFEKNATERSFNIDGFYCTWKHPFNFINLINKRKLDIAEYKKLLKLIPDASFNRERTYVVKEKIKSKFLLTFLKLFPLKYQYKIHKYLTKPIDI